MAPHTGLQLLGRGEGKAQVYSRVVLLNFGTSTYGGHVLIDFKAGT